MKLKVMVFLISSIVFVNSVFAGQTKEITLQDNTVIYGDVISFENGIYKIRTTDMGILSLAEEKIVTIKTKSEGEDIANKDIKDLKFANTPPTDPNAVKAGIEALKRGMQNDPATMRSVSDLQNDPDFMAVLNDPAIMSAVESGDINALTSNPKFLKLLNHSSVKNIDSKVEK